jgi:hypothetical protein
MTSAPSTLVDAHFELIARSPTELVAVAGDNMIVVIDRTLSVNGVLAIQRGFERLQQAYGRFGYLSVVEPSRLGTMDQRARRLMAELVGKYSPHIVAASFAVLGSGFRATAVRSVLTAIHVASRARHPMKAFAGLDAALVWYAERHPASRRDRAALARVVAALGSP